LVLLGAGLVVGVGWFYLHPLRGWVHVRDSFAMWRLDVFGGELRVGRSLELPGVLVALEPLPYDRVDVVSPDWAYMPGTASRREVERVVVERDGVVRLMTLDPRMGAEGHLRQGEFEALAAAFGQEPWEFSARLWYSAAVVLRLRRQYGEAFQVRLITAPLEGARAPYFSPARWGHAYVAADPGERLDLVVERPVDRLGTDSADHPGLVVRDRPDHPQVALYQGRFERAWEAGLVLDGELEKELLRELQDDQDG
jgi:hypothetical protein